MDYIVIVLNNYVAKPIDNSHVLLDIVFTRANLLLKCFALYFWNPSCCMYDQLHIRNATTGHG